MLSWLVIGALLVFIVYATLIEHWHLNWGASTTELTMPIPGDEQVKNPKLVSTRAVTINAPAKKIWPWLAQLGQGRGGMYSYEFLENIFGCDIHNADKIIPEFQEIKVGDVVELDGKRRAPGMPVVAVNQGQTLILGGNEWLWTFHLVKLDDNKTRMVVRTRASWSNFTAGLPTRYILVPISFIMERKMLLGIKERAES